ncbi:MAG: prepilin-type N-terminal cleavage/methylation domain-containing protein [Limisphaerales bacterium]
MDTARRHPSKSPLTAAFTLLEMSIVIVIIGLIVGGILVGQYLISAAGVRSQISQIAKYQAAVNAFQTKYMALPGDMPQKIAGRYGFATRGQYAGEGDGNGVLEGVFFDQAGADRGTWEAIGENAMFWVDLSTAGLIDGGFNTASPTANPPVHPITITGINNYLPPAKLGRGNYVYTYSGRNLGCNFTACVLDANYYGISAVTTFDAGSFSANPALSVAEAYAIDTKTDDGLPQSGNVLAMYLGYSNAAIVGAEGGGVQGPNGTAATAGSAATCYDNNDVLGHPQHYSTEISSGTGVNCALSFQFQ